MLNREFSNQPIKKRFIGAIKDALENTFPAGMAGYEVGNRGVIEQALGTSPDATSLYAVALVGFPILAAGLRALGQRIVSYPGLREKTKTQRFSNSANTGVSFIAGELLAGLPPDMQVVFGALYFGLQCIISFAARGYDNHINTYGSSDQLKG